MGAVNEDGYGIIRGEKESDGKQPLLLVHRVTLSLALGRPLGAGMNSLHHCDNSRCGRPRHLYEGTQQQNVDDMIAKGRDNSFARRAPKQRERYG